MATFVGLKIAATTTVVNPPEHLLDVAGDANISGGLEVGSNSNDPADGHFYATVDGRFGGGLYVGSIATDPASGEITATNRIFINETVNSNQTYGITIKETSAYTEMITLKSDDVAHGMTSITETDTFARLQRLKDGSPEGGYLCSGFTEDVIGVQIQGNSNVADTTEDTGSDAYVVIVGLFEGDTEPGAENNLLAVRGSTTTRFIVKGDGQIYSDFATTMTLFDEYDDIALLHGLRASIVPSLKESFGQFIDYAKPVLEANKVASFNDDGSIFISHGGLQMLTIDAVRQLYERVRMLEEQLKEA